MPVKPCGMDGRFVESIERLGEAGDPGSASSSDPSDWYNLARGKGPPFPSRGATGWCSRGDDLIMPFPRMLTSRLAFGSLPTRSSFFRVLRSTSGETRCLCTDSGSPSKPTMFSSDGRLEFRRSQPSSDECTLVGFSREFVTSPAEDSRLLFSSSLNFQ